MQTSSQPGLLTIFNLTKMRTTVKMSAMPVAIAETARSAGPLLPSCLRRGVVLRPGIIPVSVFENGIAESHHYLNHDDVKLVVC